MPVRRVCGPRDIMPTPDDPRPETLLDIGQGGTAPPPEDKHGETLLDLEGAASNESVLSRVARLAGDAPPTIQESPSAAKTVSGQGGLNDAPGRVSDAIARLGAAAARRRYTTESELGRGGMGIVLRTRDNDLRRQVAMKVIRRERLTPGTVEGVTVLRRFIEEAQITGQLEHPNIVPVHELGADAQGRPYFTMKMVKGRPLSEVLRGLRRMDARFVRDYPLDRLLQVFLKVCDALSFAHAHRVIHRDLKPDNIMLGDFGEVVVMDWGLARVLDAPGDDTAPVETDNSSRKAAGEYEPSSHSMEGAVAGTPSYMAPEQARGQLSRLDQRTDVFALGALLYDMLVLRPPYRGQNSTELLEFASRAEITDPVRRLDEDPELRQARARLPGGRVPPELAAIAMHALAEQPERRYQSAREMAADVENFIAGRPVSVRRDPLHVRIAKWVRRHPTLATTGAVALFALLAGTATVMAVMAESQREQARQQSALAAASAEKQRQSDLRARAEAELREKESALLEAEQRRNRAERLYRQGVMQASRAREISNDGLQAAARREAERLFEQSIAEDPVYADPVFELARLHAYFGDFRALARFEQADRMAREAGGPGDARALVYAGDLVRQRGDDLEAALQYYETASRVAPDDPLALVGRGYVALIRGDLASAAREARAARVLDGALWEPLLLEGVVRASFFADDGRIRNPDFDPSSAEDLFTLALERNNREGAIYAHRGKLRLELERAREAEADLRRAADLLPAREEVRVALAACLRKQHLLDESEEILTALVRNPDAVTEPATFNEYGTLLLGRGRAREALAAFRRALDLDPSRAATLCRLAAAHITLRQYDEARSFIARAMRNAPEYHEAHGLSATLYLHLEQPEQAMTDLERGLELRPGDVQMESLKVRLLALRGRADEALALGRKLTASHPDFDSGHFVLGLAHLADNAPGAAVPHFRRAAVLNPHSGEALLLLGTSLRATGGLQEAVARLETAAQVLAGDFRPWAELGRTHAAMKNWRAALESFREAVVLGDGRSETFIALARCADEFGFSAEALECARKATLSAPEEAQGWVRLALALHEGGKDDEAAQAIERARRLPWVEPEERVEVGFALLRMNRAEAALAVADDLTERRPEFVRGWMLAGNCRQALGRADLASEAYDRVIHVDQFSTEGHEALAELYFKLGRFNDAVEIARAGLRRNPANFNCLFFLGAARMALGEFALALENFEAAARVDPEKPHVWLRLGVACIELGRFSEADTHLRECLRLDSSAEEAWSLLGLCRRHLLDNEGALDCLRRSMMLNPLYAEPHMYAAELFNDIGLFDQALPLAERATNLSPKLPGGWYQLGRARLNLGQLEAALADFDRVVELVPAIGLGHMARARCLLLLSRYALAEEAGLKAAQAAAGPQPDGLILAAAAQHRLGRTNDALKTLEKALLEGANRADAFGLEQFADLKDHEGFKRLKRQYPP